MGLTKPAVYVWLSFVLFSRKSSGIRPIEYVETVDGFPGWKGELPKVPADGKPQQVSWLALAEHSIVFDLGVQLPEGLSDIACVSTGNACQP
jgi:hypothetical protein